MRLGIYFLFWTYHYTTPRLHIDSTPKRKRNKKKSALLFPYGFFFSFYNNLHGNIVEGVSINALASQPRTCHEPLADYDVIQDGGVCLTNTMAFIFPLLFRSGTMGSPRHVRWNSTVIIIIIDGSRNGCLRWKIARRPLKRSSRYVSELLREAFMEKRLKTILIDAQRLWRRRRLGTLATYRVNIQINNGVEVVL